MAKKIKPTSVSLEKWMTVPLGGMTLFTFSGFAQFVWGKNPLIGTGGNDSKEQKIWVDYDVSDLVVGPHWTEIRQICPFVVASGHDQLSPDEADAMGYEVTAIKKVVPKNFVGFSRIELRVSCRVRGGNNIDAYGLVPGLAYHVTALGKLASPVGSEGVFFGDAAF